VSYDVNFVPTRGPADEARVADVWARVEDLLGEERVERLEDAGLSVSWNATCLALSIPYSGADTPEFLALTEHVERELGQLHWIVDEETSSRG
jgi:hypothetical protein